GSALPTTWTEAASAALIALSPVVPIDVIDSSGPLVLTDTCAAVDNDALPAASIAPASTRDRRSAGFSAPAKRASPRPEASVAVSFSLWPQTTRTVLPGSAVPETLTPLVFS